MQTAALHALDLDGTYELRSVRADELQAFVQELRDGAYRGCNVTMPHKAAVASLCDELEDDASVLGVSNTVTAEDGRLYGANTDVEGFATGLRHAGLWPAPDARVVVVGAGGAAAAVTLALARVPAGHVTLVARNIRRAESVLERAAPGVPSAVVAWSPDAADAALLDADILVNATPLGRDDLPFDLAQLRSSCTVADVRYRPRPIALIAAAVALGHPATDGFEMLLSQGMLSLRRWTGLDPPWDVARDALLRALDA
jgi:shikimate dehydrogenase